MEWFTNPAALLVVIGLTGCAATLVFAVARAGTVNAQTARFQDALRHIRGSELKIDTSMESTKAPRRSWFQYWNDLYLQTGKTPSNPYVAGRIVALVSLVGAPLGFATLGGSVGILAGIPAVTGIIRLWLGWERRKRIDAINEQLPLLLGGLRAALAGRATPQQALIMVAEDMPAPLGDELRTLRADLSVNVRLDAALESLAERVPSSEVKFLAASIRIASTVGADLLPQLETIQDIVAQRARLAGKLRTAVSGVRPTQFVAYTVIPGMWLQSVMGGQRAFWFTNATGLLCLIAVAGLYFGGIVYSQILVKKVQALA